MELLCILPAPRKKHRLAHEATQLSMLYATSERRLTHAHEGQGGYLGAVLGNLAEPAS